MKNRSFIIKILIGYIFSLIVFISFVFVFFFGYLKKESIKTIVKNLDAKTYLMQDSVNNYLSNNNLEDLKSYLTDKSRYFNIRITVIDKTGLVIAETDENPNLMDNHLSRPEIERSLKNLNSYQIRYSNTVKKNMIYYAYGLKDNQQRVAYVLRVSMYIDDIDRLLFELKLKYLAVITIIIILSISAILIIYFIFKKKILFFSSISERVSEGDYNIEFIDDDSFEVHELSRSFKKMLNEIKQNIHEINTEKEANATIISSIKDGIAVISKNKKIIRVNDGFSRIFGNENILNKYYWEVIRNNELLDQINAGSTEQNRAIELEIADRTYICSINYISSKMEYVLIFYDISDFKYFEKLKKEFVTNVSHELGTPLTSVKGYTETLLEDEENNEKKSYLTIILKHTNRLINIVKDLMVLSQLDDNKNIDISETINMKDIIEPILPLFSHRINEKKLYLDVNIAPDLYSFKGNSFKLEQMMINLIDNAIKYTDNGGVSIDISNENKRLKIKITDSGIGIPEKDLSRIFERFFVVDKSRSRSVGGTGLGLSIVKHIVLLHNGEIKVESTIGKGTSFIILFYA